MNTILIGIFFVYCLYLHIKPSKPAPVVPTPDPLISKLEQEIGALKSQLHFARNFGEEKSVEISRLQESFEKLQHQKKSSEVKVGQTVEQLVGFLEDFPYPNDEIKALFQPLDLLVFRENELVFIEVKSGDAQLSDKQRKIRNLIEEKKVRFEVHRINGKGYVIK